MGDRSRAARAEDVNARRERWASVDALRGCTVAAMLLVNDPGDWAHVYAPLEHSEWNGCTPTDLIFPFFLFVMGVSVALGILARVERQADRAKLVPIALWRALRIVALGVAINVLAWWLIPDAHLRWPGVLQRIGLCFAGTAMFAIYARPGAWLAAAIGLLIGYWVLLLAGGTMAPWDNIASRIDTAVFGTHVYRIDGVTGRGHDPEGIAGTLSSLATSLLGLCAGQLLRRGQLRSLFAAAAVAMIIALAWMLWLPLNKNLWTPSFALFCAGLAGWALLAFTFAVEKLGWPAIGRRFGMNAIAAYAGSELMQILLPAFGWQHPLYDYAFAGPLTPAAGPFVASLAYAVAFVALWWLIVVALDRRRVYIRL